MPVFETRHMLINFARDFNDAPSATASKWLRQATAPACGLIAHGDNVESTSFASDVAMFTAPDTCGIVLGFTISWSQQVFAQVSHRFRRSRCEDYVRACVLRRRHDFTSDPNEDPIQRSPRAVVRDVIDFEQPVRESAVVGPCFRGQESLQLILVGEQNVARRPDHIALPESHVGKHLCAISSSLLFILKTMDMRHREIYTSSQAPPVDVRVHIGQFPDLWPVCLGLWLLQKATTYHSRYPVHVAIQLHIQMVAQRFVVAQRHEMLPFEDC